jgi:ABC-type amino acid transport substrate-binding protein
MNLFKSIVLASALLVSANVAADWNIEGQQGVMSISTENQQKQVLLFECKMDTAGMDIMVRNATGDWTSVADLEIDGQTFTTPFESWREDYYKEFYQALEKGKVVKVTTVNGSVNGTFKLSGTKDAFGSYGKPDQSCTPE